MDDEPVEIPIEDALDLHAFAPRDIPDVVGDYLEAAHAAGFRLVRLIHGRGHRRATRRRPAPPAIASARRAVLGRAREPARRDGGEAQGGLACEYSAVTRVVMPPRAVKSPTTVMRRGAQAATRSSRMRLVAAS